MYVLMRSSIVAKTNLGGIQSSLRSRKEVCCPVHDLLYVLEANGCLNQHDVDVTISVPAARMIETLGNR